MATTIVTKNSSIGGLVPSSGQLIQGELAVNVTDKKLYTLNNSGTVVLLSSGSDFTVPVTVTVNSALPAVTITQTGAGSALLVQDSANPDSTPFVVSTTGDVGIGTSSPTAQLTVSSAAATVDVARLYSGVDGAVQSETGIGFNPGTGSVNPAARISALELDAADSRASLLFYTRDTNSDVAPTERMRIDSFGNVGIGTAAPAGQALRMTRNITGSVSAYATNINPTFQSDVTSSGYVFQSIPSTQATAFTMTSLRHFYATQGTIGAGSSVTNQYGFAAESSLTGATNNYGFYGNIAAGTGRYNFYANGTADNFFGGDVIVDVSTTDAALRVTQRGAGNALLIEDSINPDSTPFVVDATGNTNIGTTGVAAKLYVSGNAAQNIAALTDAATIAVDMSTANNFSVTLGGNRTLGNPTGLIAGQSGVIFITQDGTGSKTLAYSSFWDFSGGAAPTLTTTANAVDALVYTVRTSTAIVASLIANVG